MRVFRTGSKWEENDKNLWGATKATFKEWALIVLNDYIRKKKTDFPPKTMALAFTLKNRKSSMN